MPGKTPAHAQVFGEVDRPEYTVAKVILESYPGHFVTGNLYRPKGRTGRLPAVLSPHGHWPQGRFSVTDAKTARQQIAAGAERYELGGRAPLQARCVQLARMGCIVFQHDMVGYADSVQLAHRPQPRAEMNTLHDWGFCSPQAEARLQTVLGLQTYNSIRVLDWLISRDDVDPTRIGVTGESGGGTQTFLLSAIDPRPAVAFPAVMVSTTMQGGCLCENASYLHVGTGNIEIAALIAPRPLGMSAADDWTREIASKGFPELQRHYALFGAEPLVMEKTFPQFPHNFNYPSRQVMYHWMNKHLRLGLPEPIVETDYQPLSQAEMSVWDADHPRSPSGDDYEHRLLRQMTAESQRQMAALVPRDAATLRAFREIVGEAVRVFIGRPLPDASSIEVRHRGDVDRDPFRISKLLLRNKAAHEEIPCLLLKPKAWNRQAVIWVSREGKQSLFAGGKGTQRVPGPTPAVQKLLDAGVAVLGLDLLGQGEFAADEKLWAKARINRGEKQIWAGYAGYTYGYNHPLFSQRVHDLLTAIQYARHELGATKVDLIGLHGAGHWVLAARAEAGSAVDRAVADVGDFRFARLATWDDPDFLPGGAKYFDVPGMAALSAPLPLWVTTTAGGNDWSVAAAAYRAAGTADQFRLTPEGPPDLDSQAIRWLLR